VGEPRSRRGEQTTPAAKKGSSVRSVIFSLVVAFKSLQKKEKILLIHASGSG